MTAGEDLIPLDDSGETTLPIVDVLTGRGFITGKSGSGKSNTASVIAEELLDRGFPLLVVDTDGEYWGLKEEYEILHVGADEECDLQVGPEHAGKIAELALVQNVPIILDVSGYLDAEEASELVRRTANELFTREKKLNKPFLLLVEEIHEYVPEGGGLDETGEMLIRVAKRGRKRGLGLTGMSQRPANVKKDYITQCDWIVWHRLTWENDTDVVRRVLGSGYDEDVQDLTDGEALLMADFLEADVHRVQVRRKRTFDAGATPDLGEFERPELKSVSGDLVGELEEISREEERRQDRIAELERQLEAKEATIEDLEAELERARDLSDMAREFTEAMASSGDGGEAIQAKVDEIREEKNERIRELESELEDVRAEREDLQGTTQELRERVAELEEYEQAVEHMDELREGVRRMSEALGLDATDGDEKYRKKLESARERIRELEQSVQNSDSTQTGDTLPEMVQHEAIQSAIETAKDRSRADREHHDRVVAILANSENGGPLTPQEMAPLTEVSETTVRRAAKALHKAGVLTTEQKDRATAYSLDRDFLETRIEVAEQQKRQTTSRKED